jgi:hypothetical protein
VFGYTSDGKYIDDVSNFAFIWAIALFGAGIVMGFISMCAGLACGDSQKATPTVDIKPVTVVEIV